MIKVYITRRCKITSYVLIEEDETSFTVEHYSGRNGKLVIPKLFRNACEVFSLDKYNNEFSSTDLSAVKQYALKQCNEIQEYANSHLDILQNSTDEFEKE